MEKYKESMEFHIELKEEFHNRIMRNSFDYFTILQKHWQLGERRIKGTIHFLMTDDDKPDERGYTASCEPKPTLFERLQRLDD